ncbi:MAG: hypothetical protein GY841_00320 [FCB group bacterium]|nr:hypothetical protein [FCB group bacterium]
MKRITPFLFVLAVIGLILGGCSSTTDPAETGADLEDFGTYKATDEQPDFGDPDVAELMEDEVAYDDPVAFSPVVDSTENAVRPDIFCLRMTWGNLGRDSGVVDLTDWSGKLTVSRGAVVVTHLIKFEPGQDYLLPRYNSEGFYVPEELSWVSKTSWHLDGIATRLYFPPSVTDEVVTVTYESEQLTVTFTMDELYALDTLMEIGIGNAISFQAMECEPNSNTRGSLMGRWGRDDDGNGIFHGRWISNRGDIVGSIKGEWGVDDEGNHVFVGKYIDRTGKFEGFVKGHYAKRGLSDNAAGHFWGQIYNAEKEPIGVLKGHYKRGQNRKSGFFAGRWCVGNDCFNIRD